MNKKQNVRSRFKKRELLVFIITLILGLVGGNGINLLIRPSINEMHTDSTFTIELAEEQLPAILETSDGEIEIVEVATIESIDGNQLVDECPENEPECGKGHYVYAPVDTPQAFKDYMYGKCENYDDYAGSQCVDLAAIFWMNYTNDGRVFSTCGTGAAKGSWNCKEYNAGDDFELIYDKTDLQAGDWVILSSGQYGHVGMALGGYNEGYVSLFGMNQGGRACEGGGSSANIINISLNSFVGAFRPKSYIKPAPTPDPVIPITGCLDWNVKQGDTMSGIMLNCEGTVVYGEPMNQYADTWISQIFNEGKSVYWGWTHGNGYGLYADDYLIHDIGN